MNTNPAKAGTFYLCRNDSLGWLTIYIGQHGAEYVMATDNDYRKAWHKATWNHRGPINAMTFRAEPAQIP